MEAERFDLPGEAACVALGVVAAQVPVGAQVAVGLVAVEDVEGGDRIECSTATVALAWPRRALRRAYWADR
jgi:hypothetical protein